MSPWTNGGKQKIRRVRILYFLYEKKKKKKNAACILAPPRTSTVSLCQVLEDLDDERSLL